MIEIFREHLWVSSSEDDFKRRIGEECLSFYVRGRTIGLLDGRTGRKYRLKTLGLLGDLEKAREGWRRLPKFKASLETFERRKQLREFSELGFKKDILEVLTWRQDESEPPEVKRRKAELRRVARLQRELRRGVGERAKSR